MLVTFICFDKPNSTDLRMKTRPAHLAWLEKSPLPVTFIGPILADDDTTPIGSLFIVEAESLAAAREHQKQDPYVAAGLFENIIIQPVRKVFPKA